MTPQVKSIWEVVQIVKIARGIETGLTVCIVGPYFYEIFFKVTNNEQALFYATVLWAIFFGLIAILEIPTGALGDTIGRSKMVIASVVMKVLYGLSLTSVYFCDSVATIFVIGLFSRLISALAYTFFNGNFSAWVIDSLKEKAPGFGCERLLARGHAYYSWSSIIGALIGVASYLHGIPYVAFLAGSLISLGCLTYCMAEMEETRSIPFLDMKHFGNIVSKHVAQTIKTAFRVCNKAPVIWWLLGVCAVYKFLMNVVEYLWPIAMSAQFGKSKWSLEWYGLVVAVLLATALGAHVLSWLGDRSQKQRNQKLSNRALRIWLMFAFLVASIPVIFLGFLNRNGVINFPAFALGILAVEFAYGIVEPAYETLVSNYIPHHNSQERATILSLGSVVRGFLVFFLMVPSNGGTGMNSPVGWIIPALLLLIITFLANARIRRYENAGVSKLRTTTLVEEVT